MPKPLSDRELAALDPREREFILAWRESEEAGQKFNEDHGYGSEAVESNKNIARSIRDKWKGGKQ